MAHVLERTLIIALPLPEHLGGPKRTVGQHTSTPSQLPPSSTPLPFNYDRAFWLSAQKIIFIPLRPILRILGLKVLSHRGDNTRGPINFAGTIVKELSNTVNELAASLPQGLEALVATALLDVSLDIETEELLARFGSAVWGVQAERSWLLQAVDGVKEYHKDLTFEDATDRAVIKKYLRIWTLVKGFNVWRKEGPKTHKPGFKRKRSAKGSLLIGVTSDGGDRESHTSVTGGQLIAPSPISSPFVASPKNYSGIRQSQAITAEVQTFSSPLQARVGQDLDAVAANSSSANVYTVHQPLTYARSIYTPSFQSGHAAAPIALNAYSDHNLTQDVLTILKSGDNLPPSARFSQMIPTRTESQAIGDASKSTEVRSQRNTHKTIPTYNLAILGGSSRHTPRKYLKKHYGNALHGPLDTFPSVKGMQPALAPTARMPAAPGVPKQASGTLPFTSFWPTEAWRRFLDTEAIPISVITSCLGLIGRKKGSVVTYDHPIVATLSKEISRLATRLYAQLSTESLVQCAATKNYLNQEVDLLLDNYASLIWGQDSDSSGLLEPGTQDMYMKVLVYEDDTDRKVLALYLHRWIFAKAFGFLREWGGSEEVKQAVGGALGKDAESYVVPERNYARRREKRKASPSPTRGPVKGTFSSPPPERKHEVSKQQRNAEKPKSHSTSVDGTHRLTTLFLDYLRNHADANFSEQAHLTAIEDELTSLTPHLPAFFTDKEFLSLFPAVLTAWISFRRTICTTAQELAALPDSNLSTMHEKIARSRLVTGLRKTRDAFVAAGHERVSAEAVLSSGLGGLVKSEVAGFQVGEEVKEGLVGLENELRELGESVGKGNGKWIVMG